VVHQYRKGDLRVSQLAVTPPQEPGPWEAILLEPADADRRRPAWVCAHGYIPGGMSAVTGLIDATPGGKESLKRYECDYGYQLAKRGYVTLSFHCPGFGSRSDGQPGDTVENKLVHGALHAGFPYLGWCVSDAMACVSVLRDWPTVALERVGLIGFSMGATIAAWTAAVDDRVSAAVYSGRVASLRARALRGRHLGMLEYLPGGIYPQMDKPDTLAVTAPKPMWVSQEVRDDFPVARSRVAPIKRAYEAMDAADRLTVYFDERGVHKFVGRRAYRWIETLWPL
jgi:dienelactone hydrolase